MPNTDVRTVLLPRPSGETVAHALGGVRVATNDVARQDVYRFGGDGAELRADLAERACSARESIARAHDQVQDARAELLELQRRAPAADDPKGSSLSIRAVSSVQAHADYTADVLREVWSELTHALETVERIFS